MSEDAVDLHNAAIFAAARIVQAVADNFPTTIREQPALVNSITNMLEAISVRILEVKPDAEILAACLAQSERVSRLEEALKTTAESLHRLANVVDGQPLPEPEQGEAIEIAIEDAFAAIVIARAALNDGGSDAG